MAVSIPTSFPPDTQFEEFEGIPISRNPDGNVLAWDVPGGRRFLNRGSLANSKLISEAEFRALVKQY